VKVRKVSGPKSLISNILKIFICYGNNAKENNKVIPGSNPVPYIKNLILLMLPQRITTRLYKVGFILLVLLINFVSY